MDEYIIKGSTLTDIASAIRSKSGTSAKITPENMASQIYNISGGSLIPVIGRVEFKNDSGLKISMAKDNIFMLYSPEAQALYSIGDTTFRFNNSSKISGFSITIVDDNIEWKNSTSSSNSILIGKILFSSSYMYVSPSEINAYSYETGSIKNFTVSTTSIPYDGVVIYGGNFLNDAGPVE